MVRIIGAVYLQLWLIPKGILIPPVGMVNMTSSDVGCCGHHLCETHLKQLLSDAVGWVLDKAQVEVTSD